MKSPLRVIKVGGSLFDMPDLGDRLRSFIDEQPISRNLLIAGGGPLVEEIRRLDRIASIDEELAHWMCIDLMSLTARMLAARLTLELRNSIDEVRDFERPSSVVFNPATWLYETEPHTAGTTLPIGWDVTSDSIAARLAQVLSADELVILKSTLPDSGEPSADGRQRIRGSGISRIGSRTSGHLFL